MWSKFVIFPPYCEFSNAADNHHRLFVTQMIFSSAYFNILLIAWRHNCFTFIKSFRVSRNKTASLDIECRWDRFKRRIYSLISQHRLSPLKRHNLKSYADVGSRKTTNSTLSIQNISDATNLFLYFFICIFAAHRFLLALKNVFIKRTFINVHNWNGASPILFILK